MFSEERGWYVAKADKPEKLNFFQKVCSEKIRQILRCDEDINSQLQNIESDKLNNLVRQLNYELIKYGHMLFDAFDTHVKALCGERVVKQRRPYVRINIPGRDHTSTLPHSDVFFGHSPYAYTLWIPMHDVHDNSGLYIYDKTTSLEILRNYDFKAPFNVYLSRGEFGCPENVKVNFSEALIFKCGLVHGVNKNNKSLRISFDTRVMSADKPLFEKNFELFSFRSIGE